MNKSLSKFQLALVGLFYLYTPTVFSQDIKSSSIKGLTEKSSATIPNTLDIGELEEEELRIFEEENNEELNEHDDQDKKTIKAIKSWTVELPYDADKPLIDEKIKKIKFKAVEEGAEEEETRIRRISTGELTYDEDKPVIDENVKNLVNKLRKTRKQSEESILEGEDQEGLEVEEDSLPNKHQYIEAKLTYDPDQPLIDSSMDTEGDLSVFLGNKKNLSLKGPIALLVLALQMLM